ncbi:MAG TPA: DUF4339 domain-containing protein [Rhabdochlamydiaceae bacterium]|jgi:hypothetical protein
MSFFFNLVLALINALVCFACANVAKKRGRNPTYWFIGGAFLGLIALIVLLLLPRRVMAVAPTAAAAVVAAPTPPSLRLQALFENQIGKFWYYLDAERQQNGPMSFEALSRAWNDGKLHKSSFVWNEELENWKRLEEIVQGDA